MGLEKVAMRRRREGTTDYRQRLSLLRSARPRLVVRKSDRHFTAQLVEYRDQGDDVIESTHSSELEGYGWLGGSGNTPAAYLTGYLLATRTGVDEAVLDVGLQKVDRGASLFAVAVGAREAGISLPLGGEVTPSEERMRGEHIAAYAEEGDFAKYRERGLDPSDLPDHFESVRERVCEETAGG
ncbi:MAG: 50S ribosomal protein L18 [Methanonatronarchaeales archaeon]|nr:50S ribosomal protein L18 [Methanonatronarchaeales archaeon]